MLVNFYQEAVDFSVINGEKKKKRQVLHRQAELQEESKYATCLNGQLAYFACYRCTPFKPLRQRVSSASIHSLSTTRIIIAKLVLSKKKVSRIGLIHALRKSLDTTVQQSRSKHWIMCAFLLYYTRLEFRSAFLCLQITDRH